MKKVFISSSYHDLREHRKALIDVLLRFNLQPLAMEFFGAKPLEPTQVCFNEIEASDLFVGIYAHRYGFVPEGSDSSITEQEFDLAHRSGKPCFCYVIDENHAWLPNQIDGEPARSKLTAFKDRLRLIKVRETFTDSNDLARKVAIDIGGWLGKNSDRSPLTGSVVHNLPQPDYHRFIGRRAELERIHHLLLPSSRAWTIAINGIGGIGKTALALEAAYHYVSENASLLEDRRFDAVVWTSAKTSVLTPDRISPRSRIDRTLTDVYSTIALVLARPEITQALPDRQTEQVMNVLRQQRVLLILDNLETIDDPRVHGFLVELPAPTKAIVTSRYAVDVANSIPLDELSKEEALELIDEESEKMHAGISIPEKERVYHRTGGVPIAIAWTVAQASSGYTMDQALTRLNDLTGDLSLFCFESAMKRIDGTDAYKLILALSLFSTSATRDALGKIAGLENDQNNRDEALVKLLKLFLVNFKKDRFSLLSLTRQYVLQEFGKDLNFKNKAKRRLINYYDEYWEKHRDADQGGLPVNEYLSALDELTNSLDLIDSLCNVDEWPVAAAIIHNMAGFFYLTGFWTQPIQYIEALSDIAIRATPLSSEQRLLLCHLWLDIAYLICFSNKFEFSMEWLERAKEVIDEFKANNHRGRYLAYMGAVQQQRGNYDEARSLYLERLRLSAEMGISHRVIASEYLLGVLSYMQGDIREAETRLQTVLSKAKSNYPRAVPYARAYLANIVRERGDLAVAERGYQLALSEIGDLYGSLDSRGLALINLGRAQLERRKGNSSMAQYLAESALTTFTQLGLTREIEECSEIIATLEPPIDAEK